jgi:hypothetical protein
MKFEVFTAVKMTLCDFLVLQFQQFFLGRTQAGMAFRNIFLAPM